MRIYSDLHSRLDEKERNNLNSSNIFQTDNSISCVNKKIEEINIPKEITSISFLGFSDCENLTELAIPDNVISIGKGAFDNCKKLHTITFPKNIIEFNDKTFFNCSSLKNINLPEDLESIGDYCFYNCESIDTLDLPNNVTSIGDYCFKNCTTLSELNIPEKISNLGEGAFFNCQSLKTAAIPRNIDNLNTYTFAFCEDLEEIDIPDNIKSIRDFAFFNCSSLQSVKLKDTINTISPFAFSKCTSLKDIALPDSLREVPHSLFDGCSSLESATLPKAIKSIAPSVFKNCSSLEAVNIPNSVKAIRNNAFEGCTSLKYINLPKDLKCIGSSSFYNCRELKNISLPKNIDSLGASAFDSCKSLEEIEIPISIFNLQKMTFFGCEALKSVKLPKHLYSIGFKCFANCTSLEDINLPQEIYSIDNSAFENCESLTDIRFPDSLRVISQNAFSNCKNLHKIIIPEKIIFISNTAFENCPNLVICAPKGSYAHKYAVKHGIKFEEFNFFYLRKIHFKNDSITLNRGDVKKLDLILIPQNTNDIFELKWESSDESVVSVDSEGVITCHGIGNAVITASTDKKIAKCVVLSNVKLEKITLDHTTLELANGETKRLNLSIFPEEHIAENRPLWKSTNDSVATVDKNGCVTAVSPGQCSIICTVENQSISCDVDIKIPVSEIKFDKPSINAKVGESFYITPIIYPANTTDDVQLEWQCSNNSIIELQEDKSIKAIGEGTSIIMASYKDKIATCIISITANISSIHFKEDKISLARNKSIKIQVVDNNGNDISFEKLTLSIADTSIAKLENDNIVAIKEGLTVVIAQMQGLISTCILNVLPEKINNFSINYVKESAKVITGKGLEGATIRAYNGLVPISDLAIVDDKEEFILEIDNSKLGSEVVVEISKDGYETRKETAPVLKEFEEFSISAVDEISESSLSIIGKGHPGTHIRAYIKNMQIGKTSLANENGSFTLYIPKVKPNTTITLKMRKSGYVTELKNITIKE